MIPKLPIFPLDVDEQQKMRQDVFTACINKPLSDYLLTAKGSTGFNKKGEIKAYRYTYSTFDSFNRLINKRLKLDHVRIKLDIEYFVQRPSSAIFMLDSNFQLISRKKSANLIADAFCDLAESFELLHDQHLDTINNMDQLQFQQSFGTFVALFACQSRYAGYNGYNLCFKKFHIDSVNIHVYNNKIILCVSDNSITYDEAHYLVLNSGKILKYYTSAAGKFYPNSKYALKTSEPLDFVASTDNIIGKIPVFLRLQDFWKDDFYSSQNYAVGHDVSSYYFPERCVLYKGEMPYSDVWTNQNLSRDEIILKKFKRINALSDKINFAKFTLPELSQFAGLTTKLTDQEVMRVINWYRNNRRDTKAINWTDLYCDYLKARFGYLKGKKNNNFAQFDNSLKDYLRIHNFVTNDKIQIEYKSVKRFYEEERDLSEKYVAKRDRQKYGKANQQYTVNKKWDALKKRIQGDSRIKLLDSHSKMVGEGVMQHNCVGTFYVETAYKEKSAFLDFVYGSKHHTVQVNCVSKKKDTYKIVQMYSTYNMPNAKGAKEELTKIINGE